MRISDWSSDVCSSDLTLIRASAEDESEPAKLMERVNNRLAENNPNLMFVTLIIAVLDLETGELNWTSDGHLPPCVKIGRASGRERGCQYVKISVVAVSLKKKKKKNKYKTKQQI